MRSPLWRCVLLAGVLACALLPGAVRAEGPLRVGFLSGGGGLGDQAYNDMTYKGLRQAQAEHGLLLTVVDRRDVEDSWAEVLETLADEVDVLALPGTEYAPVAPELARAHPELRIILLDSVLDPCPDNVSCVTFRQNEAAFLAGALAGYVTHTGTVGFIGGTDTRPVRDFLAGYAAGVRHVAPQVRVLQAWAAPNENFAGFRMPHRGLELALDMYDDGADIVFAAAGRTGNGVIEAARRSGNYAIGVDADQDHLARGVVLASAMKRLDTALTAQIDAIVAGEFRSGVHVMGLAEGGVGLSPMQYSRDVVGEAVRLRLAALARAVADGEITVPSAQ